MGLAAAQHAHKAARIQHAHGRHARTSAYCEIRLPHTASLAASYMSPSPPPPARLPPSSADCVPAANHNARSARETANPKERPLFRVSQPPRIDPRSSVPHPALQLTRACRDVRELRRHLLGQARLPFPPSPLRFRPLALAARWLRFREACRPLDRRRFPLAVRPARRPIVATAPAVLAAPAARVQATRRHARSPPPLGDAGSEPSGNPATGLHQPRSLAKLLSSWLPLSDPSRWLVTGSVASPRPLCLAKTDAVPATTQVFCFRRIGLTRLQALTMSHESAQPKVLAQVWVYGTERRPSLRNPPAGAAVRA